MKNRKVFIILALLVCLALGSYFFFLLHQVKTAFDSAQEYTPSRVYSNVTRIGPPMSQHYVEKKLANLGYTITVEKGQSLSFRLHSPTYPDYLLPENHPTRELKDQILTLNFYGSGDAAELDSIQSEKGPVNEFYLEPEFLAALSPDANFASGATQTGQIRESLKLAEFPKTVPDAVLAAEDSHFYSHFGIDPRGFLRAVWVNFKTLSFSQGGSTITQQLVKNLMARRNRNLFMKMNELFLAPVLEFHYTKDQILERYLNEVFLGQIGPYEVRGFSEGAKFFFGKKVTELNTAEITLLVGLIKGPAYYSPYKHFDRAKNRQRYVLERMLSTGKINQVDYQLALTQPIRIAQAPTASNRAPYFVDYVKAELIDLLKDRFQEAEIPELGLHIYTTLDLDKNMAAQESLALGLVELEKKLNIVAPQKLQGALISVDQSTGSVVALIGGRNYSESNFNRILNMKRQVGSTLKPVIFAAAFKQGEDAKGNSYTSLYPVLDEAWDWNYEKGKPIWKPKNFDKKHQGWVPLKTALAKSINTTAAKLAQKVGLGEVVATAQSLGVTSPLKPVPSLSLGGVELSPMELVTIYSTIANHGQGGKQIVIRGITNSDHSHYQQVHYEATNRLDPGIADLLTLLLEGVFSEGTGMSARAQGFTRPAAGKTGTTNDYRDAWFAGYTPELTTVVWIGPDQGVTGDLHLTGTNGALPIWTRYMNKALKYEPEIPFVDSDHLIEMRLDTKTGQRATEDCPESQVSIEKVRLGAEPKKITCEKDFSEDFR